MSGLQDFELFLLREADALASGSFQKRSIVRANISANRKLLFGFASLTYVWFVDERNRAEDWAL